MVLGSAGVAWIFVSSCGDKQSMIFGGMFYGDEIISRFVSIRPPQAHGQSIDHEVTPKWIKFGNTEGLSKDISWLILTKNKPNLIFAFVDCLE